MAAKGTWKMINLSRNDVYAWMHSQTFREIVGLEASGNEGAERKRLFFEITEITHALF